MNKLKAGSEISKFTGVSASCKSWTEGFNRLGGDLIHAQRIEILRAKVQATSEGMLNEVVLDTPTTLLKMKLLELLYSEEPWIEL